MSLTCKVKDCGESFADKGKLRDHLHEDLHRKLQSKNKHCIWCNKDITSLKRRGRMSHLDAHVEWDCTHGDCKQVFKSNATLRYHLLDYHGDYKVGTSIWFCSGTNCTYFKNQKRRIDEHSKSKHSDRPTKATRAVIDEITKNGNGTITVFFKDDGGAQRMPTITPPGKPIPTPPTIVSGAEKRKHDAQQQNLASVHKGESSVDHSKSIHLKKSKKPVAESSKSVSQSGGSKHQRRSV